MHAHVPIYRFSRKALFNASLRVNVDPKHCGGAGTRSPETNAGHAHPPPSEVLQGEYGSHRYTTIIRTCDEIDIIIL
jgi:hypothetical protein